MRRILPALLFLALGCSETFPALDLDPDLGVADAAPVLDGGPLPGLAARMVAAVGSDEAPHSVSLARRGGVAWQVPWRWDAAQGAQVAPEGTLPYEYLLPRDGGARWVPFSASSGCWRAGGERLFRVGWVDAVGTTPRSDDSVVAPVELSTVLIEGGEVSSRTMPEGFFAQTCSVDEAGHVHLVATVLRGTDLGGGPLGDDLPGSARRIVVAASFDAELNHRTSVTLGEAPAPGGLDVVPFGGDRIGLYGAPPFDRLWDTALPGGSMLASLDLEARAVTAWGIEGLVPIAPYTAWYDDGDVLLVAQFEADVATGSIGEVSVEDPGPPLVIGESPSSVYFFFDGTAPTRLGTTSLLPFLEHGPGHSLRGLGLRIREPVADMRGPDDVLVDTVLAEGAGVLWALGTDARHRESSLFHTGDLSSVTTTPYRDRRVTTVFAEGERTFGRATIGGEGNRIIRVEHGWEGEVTRVIDLGRSEEFSGSGSVALGEDRFLVQRRDQFLLLREGGEVSSTLPITVEAEGPCTVGGDRTGDEPVGSKGYWQVEVQCPRAATMSVSVGEATLGVPHPYAAFLVEVEAL